MSENAELRELKKAGLVIGKKPKIYRCYYVQGNGKEQDEGRWILKTLTEKTLVVEKITEQETFEYYEKGDTIKCGRLKGNGNTLREWSTGDFTIYPNQSGTPFVFEPLVDAEEIHQRNAEAYEDIQEVVCNTKVSN